MAVAMAARPVAVERDRPGWGVVAGFLVVASVLVSAHLPSTFFPEIDESMERIYVRLAPGTSLEESARKIDEMGETLRKELPKGAVELVLANAALAAEVAVELAALHAGRTA